MVQVTFETKCWENDYKLILGTSHLAQMIENCNYPFAHKQLIINNVNNKKLATRMAKRKISKGILDDVYCAEDYADEVLSQYNIQDRFGKGYKYSIAEVVGIYKCRTKYLLHFSSDSYIPKEFIHSNWIAEAIEIMESRSDILVANPTWNYKWEEALGESDGELGEFYIGQGFSDQCYLINTELVKKDIYNYKHPASERYPKYGGELFEKRIDSYMRCCSLKRLTAQNISYISCNITTKQKIMEALGLQKL